MTLRLLHPFATDAGWTYTVEDGCGRTVFVGGETRVADLFFPEITPPDDMVLVPRYHVEGAAELLEASGWPQYASILRNLAGVQDRHSDAAAPPLQPSKAGDDGPLPASAPAGSEAVGHREGVAA